MNREFVHEALVYDNGRDAASIVATAVDKALADGAAVICALPPPLETAVQSALAHDNDVFWLAGSGPYARPVDAIATFSSFVRRQMERGATRIDAVGHPPYTGTQTDQAWLWYDAGINAVFGEAPLHALCLVDRAAVTDTTVAGVCLTHSHVRDTNGAVVLPAAAATPSLAAPALVHPALAEAPDLSMSNAGVRAARHALLDAARDRSEDARGRGELVIAELVTNAILHGGTPAEVEMWFTPTDIVIRVTDGGPGIDDPWATLRPPRGEREGGAGLWIAHRESETLDIRNQPEGGAVATAVIRERAELMARPFPGG